MNKKTFLKITILLFSLVSFSSCTNANIINTSSSEISQISQVSSSRDDEFFSSYLENLYGANFYIFTWEVSEIESLYGVALINGWEWRYHISLNIMKDMHDKAYMSFQEVSDFAKQSYITQNEYGKQSKAWFYIVKLPTLISEEFYYMEYLIEYPASKYFVQDKSLYEKFGNTYGYDRLLSDGLINK